MSATLQSRERVHQIISDRLMVLLDSRGEQKTLCPSEVVRSIDTDLPDGWRAEMPTVRAIAFGMARAGKLSVLQKGEIRDVTKLEELKGPIRLRKMGCVKSSLGNFE